MQRIPETSAEMLAVLAQKLNAGKVREAADQLRHYGTGSHELMNAYGVILMWSGDTAKAVDVYRHLVMGGGVSLRSDLPVLYKTNFAAALLLNGNVSGCQGVLDEIDQEHNAGVIRLRLAIRRWKKSLSPWRRLWFMLSGEAPKQSVTLNFPPGDLLSETVLRPAA